MAEKLTTPFKGDPILLRGEEDQDGNLVLTELDIKQTIDESFGGEEGILKIFEGVYSQAKKGSVPHASFIMQWYFKGGEDMPESKEFEIKRTILNEKSRI